MPMGATISTFTGTTNLSNGGTGLNLRNGSVSSASITGLNLGNNQQVIIQDLVRTNISLRGTTSNANGVSCIANLQCTNTGADAGDSFDNVNVTVGSASITTQVLVGPG